MTERQKLIAQKLAMQSAKNKLKQLSGVAVSELYGENQNPALNELTAAYRATFSDHQEPYSRLPYKSSKEKICSWIIDAMELKEQGEYVLSLLFQFHSVNDPGADLFFGRFIGKSAVWFLMIRKCSAIRCGQFVQSRILVFSIKL